MATIVNVFSFMFGWLPPGLYMAVWGVVAVAVFIVLIKILTALLQVITKLFPLFLGG